MLDGQSARRAEQFADAERVFTQVQQLQGGQISDALTLEWVLLRAQQGDVDPVLDYLRSLVEADHPDSVLILEAAARGYYRAFRLNDAAFLVGLWLDRARDDVLALYLQGVIREQIGPRTEAPDNFRRVLQLDPEHDEARLRLVNLLIELAQPAEALSIVLPLLERRGQEPTVRLAYASCLFGVGEREQAEHVLDELLKVHPDFAGALTLRGRLAVDADQLDSAETWLRRAIELAPNDYDAHFQLYQVLRQKQRDAQARLIQTRMEQLGHDIRRLNAIFTDEYARRSKDPLLYLEVGSILLRSGDKPRAHRWLSDGLRLDPENRELHAKIAEYYMSVGDEKSAAAHRNFASAPMEPSLPKR